MSAMGTVQVVHRGWLEVFLEKHGGLLWKIFVGFFVLYILMPPLLLVAVSFEPSGIVRVPTGFTLHWFDVMIRTRALMDALVQSILVAFLTTAITTLLALQAALGYRKTRFKSVVIAIMILPIFLPGLIQGFSLFVLLTQFLGARRSLWTELIGHVLWALPFAFLVILTSMSVVKRETVMAAMDLGANEWRAFKDIEYPIIKPGITSAAIFSFVLSFNEFSRTYYLQGIEPTIPTYVWNKITVQITPEIFALSAITVILSLSLIAVATIYLTMVGRVAEAVPGKLKKETRALTKPTAALASTSGPVEDT